MKRKGIILLWACLIMLYMPAAAGLSGDFQSEALNAVIRAEEWGQILKEEVGNDPQDEAKDMLDICQSVLSTVQTICLLGTSDLQALEGDLKDIRSQQECVSMEGENTKVQTGIYWISDIGMYAHCTVLMGAEYYYAEYSLYTSNGELIGTERIEAGRKNERVMVLVIKFDNILNLTGRFAMWLGEGESDVIYTKTIGKHLNIPFDMDNWQEEIENESWSKKILYSIPEE